MDSRRGLDRSTQTARDSMNREPLAVRLPVPVHVVELMGKIQPMNDLERGWLAGMFDGEGTVRIDTNPFAPQISVSTSSPETRDYLISLMAEMGVDARAIEQKRRDPMKHRRNWHVRVRRVDDAFRLSREMAGISVSKREHWKIMLEWAESRLIRWRQEHSKHECDLAEKLLALNKKGPPQVN